MPIPSLDDFPHPHLAVDVALFSVHEGELQALLLRRDDAPFEGSLALPGAFVQIDEAVDETARRVLADKAGLADVFVEQLFTFGALDRDPRGRVVSVAYFALVDHTTLARAVTGRSDLQLVGLDVPWEGVRGGPVDARPPGQPDADGLPLAFDHAEVLGTVVQRLRGKLDYAALGFELLPERFTLRQLQTVHEVVLGQALNKDSFRRRMLASGQLVATGERERDVLHRPAELYRLDPSSTP